ncbi:MAG TPA: hypothetical protein VIF14_06735 [Alphaproteobacteria bacterium]|jgi:hypothetical protein
MRYGLPLSIFFHGVIVVVVLFGWPVLSRPMAEKTIEVPVEIVRFDETSNPPPGQKQDQRDDRTPDDDKTTGKSRSADGGRTRPVARPETVPERPNETEVKKPAETPDDKIATPKESDKAAPKAPERPPEPPKHEVKKPSETPETATPKSERDTATPARPPKPPKQRDVSVPEPKPVQKTPATPDSEKKTATIKKPPAPPEPERDDASLRPPPRVTTPDPSTAPERPDADRDAALPKRPAAPPKPPANQYAALRPPAAPDKSATREPKEEKPQIKSQPTFRPAPSEAEKKKEDAPAVKSRPTFRADKAKPEPREDKSKQPAPTPSKLDSIFRSLDKERKAPQEADAERTAREQRRGAPEHKPGAPLTVSEIDAVKRQIRRCWSADAAAKELESLIVIIEVWMNEDGTVREAKFAPEMRIRGPAHRAAADRALRAVLNEKCQPYKLPPEKYARWRQLKLEFDPSE